MSNVVVCVVMSREMKEKLEEKAKQMGYVSLSEFIRKILRDYIESRGVIV